MIEVSRRAYSFARDQLAFARYRLTRLALGLGVVCLLGLAGSGVAWAGLLAEPTLESATTATKLAAMQVVERTLERELLVERQRRLERQAAATRATRQGSERRLRRLAGDFVAVNDAMLDLDAEIDRRLNDVAQKQQRLEALLAEIVQLSRDEAGEPRRLAQLRAVAAALAQPFAAAKAALAETRTARATLDDRLAAIADASVEARQALLDAEVRADRLVRAAAANRLLATEALHRAEAAIAADVLAARRLERVAASRELATASMAAAAMEVRAPAAAAPISGSKALTASAPVMLEPKALTARAVVVAQPVRAAVPFDLPEMAAILPATPGAGDSAGGAQVVPVAGAVVSRFGEGQKPPFDRGLTIEVEDRRLVRAPRDGRVVFARAYEGFGLLLIIEHDSEYHSLLSGLSRFVVHEGWTVRAGQMVGTLEPGAETTGRLYVELRRRGVPVDPLTWFAAGQDKVRS